MSEKVGKVTIPLAEVLKTVVINTRESKETYLRALLYGASGTGKTTSIRTLPLERTLVVLAEPKHLPLRGHDVDAYPVDDWAGIQSAFEAIRWGLKSGELVVNGRKKDIIAIDSLSELNDQCKRQIVASDRPELLKRQSKRDVGGIYDEQLNTQDWGLLATRIDSLVGAFTHLPCHIIFTCGEQWVEDKISGELFVTPSLNGKLAMSIVHHFDEAYRLEIHEEEKKHVRYFRTARSARVMAKGSERLAELEPPNWTAVMTKIFADPTTKKEDK